MKSEDKRVLRSKVLEVENTRGGREGVELHASDRLHTWD